MVDEFLSSVNCAFTQRWSRVSDFSSFSLDRVHLGKWRPSLARKWSIVVFVTKQSRLDNLPNNLAILFSCWEILFFAFFNIFFLSCCVFRLQGALPLWNRRRATQLLRYVIDVNFCRMISHNFQLIITAIILIDNKVNQYPRLLSSPESASQKDCHTKCRV